MTRRIMDAALQSEAEPLRDEALNASGIAYQVGAHRLEYLQPDDDSSPLQQRIAANRPLPCRMRFRTDGEPRVIAPQDAAGVRIELV